MPSERAVHCASALRSHVDSVDLAARYERVMRTVKNSGNLDAAMQSK